MLQSQATSIIIWCHRIEPLFCPSFHVVLWLPALWSVPPDWPIYYYVVPHLLMFARRFSTCHIKFSVPRLLSTASVSRPSLLHTLQFPPLQTARIPHPVAINEPSKAGLQQDFVHFPSALYGCSDVLCRGDVRHCVAILFRIRTTFCHPPRSYFGRLLVLKLGCWQQARHRKSFIRRKLSLSFGPFHAKIATH